MACILRNSNNEIVSVENNKGKPSKLFQQALALTNDKEQAAKIWAVGYSDNFNNQSEPSLEQVLNYMRRNNNQNKALSNSDTLGLFNNTLSIPFNSKEELYQALNKLVVKGSFTFSKATLRATGVYTNAEIDNILGDSSLQTEIKSMYDKLEADVALSDVQTQELAALESPELTAVFDTSQTTGIGKFLQINPYIVDTQIREAVGGIKSREAFDQAMSNSNIDEAIVERYFSDAAYGNRLFELYSEMDRMPMLQDDGNGGVEAVTNSNIKHLTENALVVGENTKQLRDIVDLLISTPKSVWTNSGIEIEDMLLRVEDYAADLGIDVVGISNQEYTYEDMMNFLGTLENLAAKAEDNLVEESDLQDFILNHNIVFKNDLSPKNTAEKVSPKNQGKTLVKVDTVQTEQELFDKFSLIRTEHQDVYQRVNRQEDTESLYDYVTDLIQFNPLMIERAALYPSAYNSKGEFDLRIAKNPANREAVREDIVRYVQQQPHSEDLTLYKIAFNQPINIAEQKLSPDNFTKPAKSFDYLSGEFIQDFAKVYLQEKQKESELFDKVLKHFTFTDAGIKLNDTDPYSKEEIRLLLPKTGVLNSLRDYAKISKDSNLNTLFENEGQPVSLREFYANNPQQLEKKALQYEVSGEHLTTQNLQDGYINVDNQVYEKIQDYKNLSIYQRLPSPQNKHLNNFSVDFKVAKPDYKAFESLVQVVDNITKIEKLYTNKQVQDKIC